MRENSVESGGVQNVQFACKGVIILEFRGVREMNLEVKVVPGLGIEPRTRGFSIPCSTD
ncbi:hypothetical protein A4157S3_590003 [Escherichia coli]|nr:hypothetical protein A4157S2_360004 [Escherichia coli]SOQ74096.1 hypothetical protein A4157S3_590003 [Escherichia coli]SOQ76294.1 hypothetical protein AT4157R_1660113 [Escherichia coli]SOQ91273.1 hypothetical protein NC86S1_250114 [Escherichia coli]SOQ99031.1 hypothetical protein NC86S2_90003 [Escherichia coli]